MQRTRQLIVGGAIAAALLATDTRVAIAGSRGVTPDPEPERRNEAESTELIVYPRSVEMVDELPKTVSGTIQRRELRVSEAAGAG